MGEIGLVLEFGQKYASLDLPLSEHRRIGHHNGQLTVKVLHVQRLSSMETIVA